MARGRIRPKASLANYVSYDYELCRSWPGMCYSICASTRATRGPGLPYRNLCLLTVVKGLAISGQIKEKIYKYIEVGGLR